VLSYAVTAQQRDPASFAALVRRHDERLRTLAYKMMLGDRARMDDVLQDAYLRAFRSYADFREDADTGTWLHRIVYNACVDDLRSARRRSSLQGALEAATLRSTASPGPERSVEARDAVLRGLAALPPDQRATVLLVDGEGFDNVSAAEVLGVAPGTIASRLSRARAELRRLLTEEER